MDSLVYTIDDGEDDEEDANESNDKITTWPIILGSVLGAAALIAAIVGIIFFYRRRQKKPEGPIWDAPVFEDNTIGLVMESTPLISSFGDNLDSLHQQRTDAVPVPEYTDYSASGSGADSGVGESFRYLPLDFCF